ncbi:galectin-9-like isoform X1 [Haliotis asinina]|uniref:galectin-9-like isoform X1 n=1 Tax=Haliotis asinina TaxID=109174 RepID=UPI003531A458
MAFMSSRIDPPEHIYIPGGLRVGASIIIRGKTQYGCESFSINLKCGDGDDCNIPFHFNPRPASNEVIRNSYMGGWQDEEKDQPYFPFLEGRSFQVRIHASHDEFRVTVNGKDFITYSYRTDLSEIRYLQLGSGAEYSDVTIQNSMTNPYFEEFKRGFGVGQAVRIRGAVKDDAESFSVNFNCDCGGDTTGFHFNPRFEDGEVVRNANLDGWGEEERGQDDFPFSRGAMFDALFIAQEDRFNIYINEKYFALFNYRCDVNDIRYLTINGDISICDVEFFEPLPDDFMKEIPSGLENSDMIVVKGFFYPEGDRFAINLMNGDSLDDDVGLHFNPRRGEGEVVLNNRVDGEWLEEEREAIPYAFQELLPFEVKIVVKKNKFKIYVNGKKLTSFRSRCSVEAMRRINVNGSAYFYQAKLLRRLELPDVERIPGSLQPGSWVVVNGTAKKEAQSFAINLQCGDSGDYNTDIALHFNPRFSGEDSVRNTHEDGGWGEEELEQPNFPFEPKDAFEVAINCLEDRYRIYVNGYHYVDYNHRIDYHRVCHLMLTGDANFFEPEFF